MKCREGTKTVKTDFLKNFKKVFKQKQKNMRPTKMYLSIEINETWLKAGNNLPKVILKEIRECTESEFYAILAQYERREGKYGMNNTSLDHCHWITEEIANYRIKKSI